MTRSAHIYPHAGCCLVGRQIPSMVLPHPCMLGTPHPCMLGTPHPHNVLFTRASPGNKKQESKSCSIVRIARPNPPPPARPPIPPSLPARGGGLQTRACACPSIYRPASPAAHAPEPKTPLGAALTWGWFTHAHSHSSTPLFSPCSRLRSLPPSLARSLARSCPRTLLWSLHLRCEPPATVGIGGPEIAMGTKNKASTAPTRLNNNLLIFIYFRSGLPLPFASHRFW